MIVPIPHTVHGWLDSHFSPELPQKVLMTGGNNRPVKTHDVSFADSMSDEFRVEHGFTFATLLLRFPILTVLMKDMQEGIIHAVEPDNCELHVSRRNNSADLPHVRPPNRQCHTVSAVVYHNTSRTLSQSCATLTVHTDDVEHVH